MLDPLETLSFTPPDVDLKQMHKSLRQKICNRFKTLGLASSLVLLEGGKQQTRYDTDKEELFRQESFFHYLFGVKEAGFWGAVHPASETSFLFIPRLNSEWAIWEGQIHSCDHFKESYGVDFVYFIDELESKLISHEFSSEWTEIHVLHGQNSDSGKMFIEPDLSLFPKLSKFSVKKDVLLKELSECRVIKLPEELELLRYVSDVSSAAHRFVMRSIKPEMFEFQLESFFLHYCSFHMHARFVPYTCICCSGPNGAVLHYGGASSPLERKLKDGDMCLLDMGSEHHCYVSDITCSYPSNGKFSDDQKMIYQAVYNAQRAVERAIRPGIEWLDMHRLAERVLMEHMVESGFVRGEIDELLQMRIPALFMPHGLGHLMGLDVHDVGGYPEGRERVDEAALRNLRANRILEEGMVLSNEPGLYFIRSLLEPAFEDPKLGIYLNKSKLQLFLDNEFGGIRLEDDIIVTSSGCETMTKVPRTIEEVEAEMSKDPFVLE